MAHCIYSGKHVWKTFGSQNQLFTDSDRFALWMKPFIFFFRLILCLFILWTVPLAGSISFGKCNSNNFNGNCSLYWHSKAINIGITFIERFFSESLLKVKINKIRLKYGMNAANFMQSQNYRILCHAYLNRNFTLKLKKNEINLSCDSVRVFPFYRSAFMRSNKRNKWSYHRW